MRNAFAQEIFDLAASDERVVLLMGDIGNRLFDKYRAQFPDRFFNCGVAEANMVSVAAGLASEGMRPVCYTITPFLTYRSLEQIRVDVCYHQVPVILVGTGSGLSYASLGATHHSCEDIGMLRLLPGMTVLCPADALETKSCLAAALGHPGPVYIRIGKKGEPAIHSERPLVQIGHAFPLRSGEKICLLGTGVMTHVALAAADLVSVREGFSPSVVSFHTVKPLDEDFLAQTFATFDLVVTIEEHSILGGLGGSVAEWAARQQGLRARLMALGTADEFLHETSTLKSARRHFGLTPERIADRIDDSFH
jgi:transketolase